MQKPVLGLLVLQTAILLFLVYHVNGLQKRTDRLSADIAAMAINPGEPPSQFTPSPVVQKNQNTEQIRRVIREEIGPLSEQIEAFSKGVSTPAAAPVPVVDSREIARIKSIATRQIATFTSQGSASPGELASFERNIAKLPVSEQKKVLAELNRAINNGQIQARF